VHGAVFEKDAPTIGGARRLSVKRGGIVVGSLVHHPDGTSLAFEAGAKLRMTLQKAGDAT
jgi:hypothetical protein